MPPDAYPPQLSPSLLRELEDTDSTAVVLRPDNHIAYRNPAWHRFAAQNGAQLPLQPGNYLPESCEPQIRAFYESLFDGVRTKQQPAEHLYECSTPDEFREFVLRVLPLATDHLLLLHHLSVSRPHDRRAHEPSSGYVNADGLIIQCAHCRCTQRAHHPTTWDWVPAFLGPDERISHGLCGPCLQHYYLREPTAET